MAESAIHIEGIDEATRQHVRIHLRVLTSEEAVPAAVRFAAPRGFLPGMSNGDVAGCRQAGAGSCQAQVFSSARLAVSPTGPGVFAAPRGFLPEA